VIIVDTSVWVDFLNGLTNPESQWLDLNLDRVRIGVPTIVLCEVLQGLRDDREAALVHAQLMHFEIVALDDVALAVDAAQHYRRLRRAGRTVRTTIDLLIATYCIREHHSLLHRDRDFDIFEERLGLSVIHAADVGAD
jgi:predicted nucleic acid-binding protein